MYTHRHTLLVLTLAVSAFLASGASCKNPAVKITGPDNGAFRTESTVTIEGRIVDVNVTNAAVTVNGNPVTIQPDKTWSINLPLDQNAVVNAYLAEMTILSNGNTKRDRIVVMGGQSIFDGMFSPASLVLRINDSGLDQVEPLVGGLVSFDLATLLPVGSVVISDCFIDSFLGCLGSGTVTVANPPPSITGFTIDADSQNTFLFGSTTVNDLRIDLQLNGSGLVPTCGIRLTADSLGLPGNFDLIPSGSGIDVNQIGNINAVFGGFNDEFTSGICDAPIIGDIIGLFLPNIESLTEQGLEDFMQDPDGPGPADSPIAEAVETGLAGIDLAGEIGGVLTGVTLEAPGILPPDDNEVEDSVGITLGADGRITSDVGPDTQTQCQPPFGIGSSPDLTESLEVPAAFPSFGATTPGGGLPYGLGICLSPSAFNQLLKAGIECGLLQLELTEVSIVPGGDPVPLTASLLASFDAAFAGFDPDTPMKIVITPTIAPVITGDAGPGGELVELLVPGLKFEIRDGNINALYVGAVIDLTLGADVTIDQGELMATVAEPDPLDIDLDIVQNVIGVNTVFLEAVLPFILSPVFPSLADTLGSFPLPEFLGVQLSAVEIGNNGDFISIFADLNPTP